MLVLHVVAPGEIGGLERVVQLLAQGQARAGLDVHVALVSDQPEHPFAASLAAEGRGATPHALVVPGRAYRRERAMVLELCRRLKPDVVHTHGARPDVVDAPVARRLDIPTVTTVHGFCGGGWKNRLYERLQRRAFRNFAGVVVVSHPLRDQLIQDGVPASRIHVAQNAWDETAAPPLDRAAARSALGVSQDGFRIGWVGRLSPEKGPDVLIGALAHLADLPFSVSVVGNGRRDSLDEHARRLGVEGRIQWHGLVPHVARAFAAFDVFVLSSRTEGTPIVLFEAMAATVPIVAARVGGVPDVISPGEASLFPPGDVVALAAAVRAIYQNPVAARTRAQQARARLLSDFTVAPWIRRYEEIYRRVREPAAPEVATA